MGDGHDCWDIAYRNGLVGPGGSALGEAPCPWYENIRGSFIMNHSGCDAV